MLRSLGHTERLRRCFPRPVYPPAQLAARITQRAAGDLEKVGRRGGVPFRADSAGRDRETTAAGTATAQVCSRFLLREAVRRHRDTARRTEPREGA
ncbi:hypothetical protein MTO96_013999 [Rhipicephalus appendiculatus]